MKRGELWWADLPEPVGSEPGYRRPVLIVSDDNFNRSAIRTVLIVPLTSNLNVRRAPGNIFLASQETGLGRDSVLNISQVYDAGQGVFGRAYWEAGGRFTRERRKRS